MSGYMKIPDAAQRLELSEKTVRRHVKSGELPSVFIGGVYRISEEGLEAFIESRRVEGPLALGRASLDFPGRADLEVFERPPKALAPFRNPADGAYPILSLTRRIDATGSRWWGYLTHPPAPRPSYREMRATWREISPQASDFDAEIGELSPALANATPEDRRDLYDAHARLYEAQDAFYVEMLRKHEMERKKSQTSEALEAQET